MNPTAEDAQYDYFDLPEEILDAEAEAELAGEFAMSWTTGGGDAGDAGVAYRTLEF